MGVVGPEAVGEDLRASELGLLPQDDSNSLLGGIVEENPTPNDAGNAVINGGMIGDLDPWFAHPCFLL